MLGAARSGMGFGGRHGGSADVVAVYSVVKVPNVL